MPSTMQILNPGVDGGKFTLNLVDYVWRTMIRKERRGITTTQKIDIKSVSWFLPLYSQMSLTPNLTRAAV